MAFKDSTDEKFQEQISGDKLSLIQFSASWCGTCQQLKPIIQKISNETKKEIEVLEKEILYIDHLRWNKDDEHLKLFK